MRSPKLSEVLYESDNGIAKITLNRPHKLNSLTAQMLADIRSALDFIEHDPTIKVILLTGAGQGFCAGQDLNESRLKDEALGPILESDYNPIIQRLTTMQQVVIAAVNGIAAGAGCSLALAADLTLAGKTTRFKQAFIHLGLLPDAGATWFLPHRVGIQKAMGLAMTGETITGTEAEHLGLIWKAVDDHLVLHEAEQLAFNLANSSHHALPEIKKSIYAASQNSLAEQLDLERDAQNRLGKTAEFQMALATFQSKQKKSNE